ncbi:MAG: hypothetical protein ACPGUV_11765 [Polyangiales bacterium]
MQWQPIQSALTASGRFALQHPKLVWQALRHAASWRLAVPLPWLRALVTAFEQPGGKFSAVELEARAPGLHLGLNLRAMGMQLRLRATLAVTHLVLQPDQARITLRVADLAAQVLGGKESALSALLRSGALDLSQPGEVLRFMPKRPKAVLRAEGEEIELDLLTIDALRHDLLWQRILKHFAGAFSVAGVDCRDDWLTIQLQPRPQGMGGVFALFCRS